MNTPRPVFFVSAVCLLSPARAQGPTDCTTSAASVNDLGVLADKHSSGCAVSADGLAVAFASHADNLAPTNPGDIADIFVRDLLTGQTTVVSVDSSGNPGNSSSFYPDISADGRFVVFSSFASNLVAGPTTVRGAYVHDRQTGETTRASVSSTGEEANHRSDNVKVSADGRYVSFQTRAWNLDVNDTNFLDDAYVHDRWTGGTRRASVGTQGQESDVNISHPEISGDGRWVTFHTAATTLVPNITNDRSDIFLRDQLEGVLTRISLSPTGAEANNHCTEPVISHDGSVIVFATRATNLVVPDTNGSWDILAYDRINGTLERISQRANGLQGNGDSQHAEISPCGNFVTFRSGADNLVPNDTNNTNDVLVKDRRTGELWIASRNTAGEQTNLHSLYQSISGGGCTVAFTSAATNMVPNDTNSVDDVFVRRCTPEVVNYCIGAANSFSTGATIATLGSTSVTANDLFLEATGVVPGQFGIFCYGPHRDQVQLGDGFLCLGAGSTGLFRLHPPELSDASGTVLRHLDLTQPPASTGPGEILAGHTWNFQYWYRDPLGGFGNNLTDAVSVPFCH